MITLTLDDGHHAPRACRLSPNGPGTWDEMSPGEMLQALRCLYEAEAALEQMITANMQLRSDGGAQHE